jgi:hypothetical protein
MADNAPKDGSKRRRGLLRGPSQGVEEWTAYLQKFVDWLIGARGRWHRSGPQKTIKPSVVLVGGSTVVVVVRFLTG